MGDPTAGTVFLANDTIIGDDKLNQLHHEFSTQAYCRPYLCTNFSALCCPRDPSLLPTTSPPHRSTPSAMVACSYLHEVNGSEVALM
jgi:hypothetical protein